jgi:hypothetical protein
MPSYPVMCYTKGCPERAIYKIATRWTDGITSELKTYSLSCEACLKNAFLDARKRRQACRLTVGESLEIPSIYRLSDGTRDRELTRLPETEEAILVSSS